MRNKSMTDEELRRRYPDIADDLIAKRNAEDARRRREVKGKKRSAYSKPMVEVKKKKKDKKEDNMQKLYRLTDKIGGILGGTIKKVKKRKDKAKDY